jgi:glucose/arabinose dehydrogenase
MLAAARRLAFATAVMAAVMAACAPAVAGDAGVAGAQARSAGPVTEASLRKLRLPDGYRVALYARDLPGVRFMAVGPDGAVYASQPRSGRVVRLGDADADGVADSVVVAVDGLDRPHGLAFHDGWLYVANTGGVVRVRLDASGRARGTPQRLNQYSAGGGHWSRSLIFGPDGRLYVSIGSSCNLCEEKTEDRAAVMVYDADGTNGQLYASGLRNAVGMAVHPGTRQIWVSQHERDMLKPDHQDLPPEEINILQAGGHYGWPYCYGNRVPNPEYADAKRCASTIPPALEMQAHAAPLGMTFLTGATQFPAAMRGDLLLAFHGSWNRDVPTGATVVRVRVADGRPVGYEDFVTGWQNADGTRWGRPVDVLVARDGAVLISDDAGGAIYRVTR